MSVRGYVKFRSKEPVGKKPDYYSVGGYAVVMPDGILRNFDWAEYSSSCEVNEDGRIYLETQMRYFDVEFSELGEIFIDGVKASDAIEARDLLTGDLDEVAYECGFTEGPDHVELELVAFGFLECQDGRWKNYDFSQDKINVYNGRS